CTEFMGKACDVYGSPYEAERHVGGTRKALKKAFERMRERRRRLQDVSLVAGGQVGDGSYGRSDREDDSGSPAASDSDDSDDSDGDSDGGDTDHSDNDHHNDHGDLEMSGGGDIRALA
ncbi:MAG: hypothetical protein AAGC55_19360, partial [Myxococcota bacterium]